MKLTKEQIKRARELQALAVTVFLEMSAREFAVFMQTKEVGDKIVLRALKRVQG